MAGTALSRLRGSQRQVTNTYTSDRMATRFLCDLKTSVDSDELHPGIRYCTHVTQVAGPQPSYAYIGVPVNTWNYEQAPTVALQANGPAGKIKLRTRARIKYVNEENNSVDLLAGFIVKYDNSLTEDSIVASVFDDRWLMGKITVAGRATYDPETKKHYYDMSQPAIFNRDGWQDCLDTPYGPRFAPSRRYGYGSTVDSQGLRREPAPGSATASARSWRCRDIAAYLRAMHTSNGKKPNNPQNYGNLDLPGWLTWPASFGTDSFFDRTPRNMDVQGNTLLEAMNVLCRYAGPFDIWIQPNGFYGVLSLVRVDVRFSGAFLYMPQYRSLDIDGALNNSSVVQGGNISESIINYFDDTCICGDPPAVERLFSTSNVDTSLSPPRVLEPAWTDHEETAFKNLVISEGNNEDAFLKACDAFPLVYAAWRFKANPEDPVWSTNSKWANSANLNRPRFQSMLLSAFSGGSSTNPRDWQRMPITVEYYDANIEKTWLAAERFDGLEIAQDGTYLWFPGIRAKHQSFERSLFDGSTFVKRQMRLTAAAQAFFRITGIDKRDPNRTSHRINANGCRFTYMAPAENEDYVDWERETSHPVGTGVGEPYFSQNWPDAVGAGNELFTDDERLDRHARHRNLDVRRIEYAGTVTLQRFNPSIKPGDAIVVEGGGIAPRGVVRAVTWDADTQIQTVELCAADQKQIYDIPTGGGYAVPQPTQPPPSSVPTSTGGGDNSDTTWNEAQYQKEMAKSDSKHISHQAQASGTPSPTPDTPAPATPEKGGSATDREILSKIGASPAGATKAAPTQAVSNRGGKIYTPEDPGGWNRMRWEENQSPSGIHTGEARNQLDHDRIKKQRMAEGLTPDERRAMAPETPAEEKARTNPGRWQGNEEE